MGLVARPALTAGTPVRRITITAHFAVVVGAAGLFFGGLALAFGSPYGLSMLLAGLGLSSGGAFLGWFFGFPPLWRPRGWENAVSRDGRRFVVSTLPYPPCVSWRRRAPAFGTAVFPGLHEDPAEPCAAIYGLHWRDRAEAQRGHRWVVDSLENGRFADLEPYGAVGSGHAGGPGEKRRAC